MDLTKATFDHFNKEFGFKKVEVVCECGQHEGLHEDFATEQDYYQAEQLAEQEARWGADNKN